MLWRDGRPRLVHLLARYLETDKGDHKPFSIGQECSYSDWWNRFSQWSISSTTNGRLISRSPWYQPGYASRSLATKISRPPSWFFWAWMASESCEVFWWLRCSWILSPDQWGPRWLYFQDQTIRRSRLKRRRSLAARSSTDSTAHGGCSTGEYQSKVICSLISIA